MATGSVLPLRRRQVVQGPRNLFSLIPHDIENLFDRFFDDFTPCAPNGRKNGDAVESFNPRLNFEENDKEILITGEFPGMEDKDIEVSVGDDNLTLRGEKKRDFERTEGGSTWVGRTYGSFERVLPLRAEIDHDKVTATMKNGVLTIRLPKTEESKSKLRTVSIQKA